MSSRQFGAGNTTLAEPQFMARMDTTPLPSLTAHEHSSVLDFSDKIERLAARPRVPARLGKERSGKKREESRGCGANRGHGPLGAFPTYSRY